MANLGNIIKLTNAQYNTLINGGTITKDGATFSYDPNAIYLTDANGSGPAGTLKQFNNGTSVDINNDLDGPGYYYIYASHPNSSSTIWGDIGVVLITTKTNNFNNSVKYLGEAYITKLSSAWSTFYYWLIYTSESKFELRASETRPTASNSDGAADCTFYFIKLFDL